VAAAEAGEAPARPMVFRDRKNSVALGVAPRAATH
jgi:hypothetical protein